MASDHVIRASDRDRDAVVATLREAYAAGRLTLEEFQERSAVAYIAKTWGDLRELTADLPEQPALGADLPSHLRPLAAPGYPVQPYPVSGRPVPGDPASGQWDGEGQPDEDGQPNPYLPVAGPPGVPPGAVPPPPPGPARRHRGNPVVPIALVWFLVILATRGGAVVVAPLMVVVLVVLFTVFSSRR
jgi:hypothetical protein